MYDLAEIFSLEVECYIEKAAKLPFLISEKETKEINMKNNAINVFFIVQIFLCQSYDLSLFHCSLSIYYIF